MMRFVKKTGTLFLASMMAVSSLVLVPFVKASATELLEENLINKTASDVAIVAYTSECIPFNGMPDDSRASYVLDKNPNTHWHTAWKDVNTGASIGELPQSITFDLKAEYELSDIAFLCRQDRETWSGQNNIQYNGDIVKAKIYVGDSVDTMELIGTYTFETTGSGTSMMLSNRSEYKHIELDATGRYVKFEAIESCADSRVNAWASMAEINFYKKGESVVEVNKDALNASIATADAFNEADYTEESWTTVAAANEAAKAVVANENATQEEVDAAKANLDAAVAALVEKPQIVAPLAVENLKAVDKAYNKVSLTWTASEGATAYDVYQKAHDSENFEFVATVSEAEYTATVKMTGKENKFYVVAKNEAGASDACEAVAMTTTLHGKVKLEMEKYSTARFKLSWNKIAGATRYIIYTKRGEDDWKKVLTLGKDKLSYVTTELPNGEYNYIIRAARYDSSDRVMTPKSNAKTGTVEKLAPTLKVELSGTKAALSWDKMEGVNYYQIYRKIGSGEYTKVKTTAELNFTAKLSKGKKYTFRVRGYKQYRSGKDTKYIVYTSYATSKALTAK